MLLVSSLLFLPREKHDYACTSSTFFILPIKKMNSHEKNAEKKTTTNSKGDGIGIKIGMLFAFGFFVLSFVMPQKVFPFLYKVISSLMGKR